MTDSNATFGIPETNEEKIARLERLVKEQAEALRLVGKAAPAEDAPKNLDSQGFAKEYVKLRIFKGTQKHDLTHVPLGIGGYVVQVERGPEVIIHKAFAAILEDAIEDVTIDGDGGLVTRPAHRFPFQILGPATEAEYQEFHAKMKAGAAPVARA